MASANEVLGSESVQSYYDPKEDVNIPIIPKQLYRTHITSCRIAEVSVRKKYKAMVYNCKVKIADENKELTYRDEDKGVDVNGGAFSGKSVKVSGIFFFLRPSDEDTFKDNSGGNEEYLKFCEAIGVECPEIEIKVDGEKRMVKTLPELNEQDIVGKPLLAHIDQSSFVNKEGKKVDYFEVKAFEEWEGATARDFDEEDLPF